MTNDSLGYSHAVQVNLRPLKQGIVGTGQHCLSLGHCIDFTCACLLTCVEVGKEPIAVLVHTSKEFVCRHRFLHLDGLLLIILQHLGLGVGLLAFLGLNRLGVGCPLLGGICHELFILFLILLLFDFNFSDLFVQIGHHCI